MAKKQWQKKEDRDGKDFGAIPMPRSGWLWFAKGDRRNDQFLIESKQTKHQSFSITEKLWKKIEREALLSQRLPLFSIELGNGVELAIMDKNDFISLKEVIINRAKT